MARAGILREDDRVELLDGEILEMTPIGSRHAACVDRLNQLFSDQVRRRAIVRIQNPIRLSERSEPQPDLTLLRPRPDFYAQAHPGPGDVLLVVEVAETSADVDRDVKVPLYSAARNLGYTFARAASFAGKALGLAGHVASPRPSPRALPRGAGRRPSSDSPPDCAVPGDLSPILRTAQYARAGILEVWLVDLAGECIEVSRTPTPQGYQEVRRVRRGDRLVPDAFPDLEFVPDTIIG